MSVISNLDKFYRPHEYKHEYKSERVIGTYLYPYRLFGEPNWNDPYSATEVVAKIDIKANEILVTCNGGLFIRPPIRLPSLFDTNITHAEHKKVFKEKLAFEEKAATFFNYIICELALRGIVSEPATPVHIAIGNLIDNHALITSTSGGRESYLERTINPSTQLIQGLWKMHPMHQMKIVEQVAKQEYTSQLAQVSSFLPTLIASTYSHFSQRQLSEALIDSWIVIEQIIDWLWKAYVSTITDTLRKKRLSGTKNAAIRIEILHTIGTLPPLLYQAINIARDHRNGLAHRAEIDLPKATDGVNAMKQMIEFFCKKTIESPQTATGIDW